MLEKLIPEAHAQIGTAREAAEAGKEAGAAGVQQLFSFVARNIDNWIAGIIVVIISYILAKMVAKAAKEAILRKKGEEVQESVLILVDRITTFTILGVGITIALAINGLNFTLVIGALSLGIGFALKDIIGNFISGIIMLSQTRVKIGDLIKVGDILGTIVSIDTRATILQSVDGTEIVIPNQSMLNETLISYSTNPFRRIELIVGVDYNTDLPMVTSLIKGIIEKDKDIVIKPEPLVLVNEFGDSAINIKVLFWIESSKSWMKIRSNLANRIKKTFNELNINIPFPIRTLKLDEDDRSFLKTMDSMKKGVVPEPTPAPTREDVVKAAEGTENAPQVPEEIFKEEKPVPKVTPKPAPAGMRPAAPAKPAPKPEVTKKEEPKPPPTHL
jgi:small-conductance mechanosensitive channel